MLVTHRIKGLRDGTLKVWIHFSFLWISLCGFVRSLALSYSTDYIKGQSDTMSRQIHSMLFS